MIVTNQATDTKQNFNATSTRNRIMASTMSVDEYFDELIDKVREDDANSERLLAEHDKAKVQKAMVRDSLTRAFDELHSGRVHYDARKLFAEKIRDILIALKRIVPKESWQVYEPKQKQGCLSVTFINGFLNVIRCQIKDTGTLLSSEEYYQKLKDIKIDKLKDYKSSQYNKMGNTIYAEYIKCKDSI
jgi:hypothetical protein